MSKIVKRDLVKKLPFDCWGSIILFLEKGKDLVSLLLSIKGLYNFVKFQRIECTKNSVFVSHNLPSSKTTIVTNLLFSLVRNKYKQGGKSVTDLLRNLGCECFEDLFDRVFLLLPNLVRLNLNLETPWCLQKTEKHPPISLSRKFCHQNLVVLDLDLPSSFSLSQHFPRVERLYLRRVKKPENFENENGWSLSVDWSCFPRLYSLNLYDWVIEDMTTFDLISLKDRLRSFYSIDVEGLSFKTHPLSNFPLLETFVINFTDPQDIFNEVIENVPKLKSLNIHLSESVTGTETTLETLKVIRNLPQVESIFCKETTFKGLETIENMPNLRYLDVEVTENFRGLIQLEKLEELELMFDSDRIHRDFTSIIGFQHLEMIHLSFMTLYRDDQLEDLRTRNIRKFEISNLPSLKKLKVSYSHYVKIIVNEVPKLRKISFDGTPSILPEFKDLEIVKKLESVFLELGHHIVLENYTTETKRSLIPILQNLRDIKTLSIKGSLVEFLPEDDNEAAKRSLLILMNLIDFPDLESVDIENKTGIRLTTIRNCPKLESLSFTPSFDFSLSELPNLRSLNVGGLISRFRRQLLLRELQNMSIRKLFFSCHNKHDEVIRFEQSSPLRHVQELSIEYSGWLNLICPKKYGASDLETLTLKGHGSIDVVGFDKLKTLSFRYREKKMVGSFRISVKDCKSMESISIFVGFREEEKDLPVVNIKLENIPNLQELDAIGVENLIMNRVPGVNVELRRADFDIQLSRKKEF